MPYKFFNPFKTKLTVWHRDLLKNWPKRQPDASAVENNVGDVSQDNVDDAANNANNDACIANAAH